MVPLRRKWVLNIAQNFPTTTRRLLPAYPPLLEHYAYLLTYISFVYTTNQPTDPDGRIDIGKVRIQIAAW